MIPQLLLLAAHFVGVGALSSQRNTVGSNAVNFELIHQQGYPDSRCTFGAGSEPLFKKYLTNESCAAAVHALGKTAFTWEPYGRHRGSCFAENVQVTDEAWDGWQAAIEAGTPPTCPGGGWEYHRYTNFYAWPPIKKEKAAPAPTVPPIRPAPTVPPIRINTDLSAPSATGDPHMVNVHGQHFDIYQSGIHVLLQIPEVATQHRTLLRVEASVTRVGGQCADAYFRAFNLTGRWVDVDRFSRSYHRGAGIMISVNSSDKESKWQQMGPMGLRVAWGHTHDGVEYLNLYLRQMSKVHYAIGGLLGNADHTKVSTPGLLCKKSVSLLRKMSLLAGGAGISAEQELQRSVVEMSQ